MAKLIRWLGAIIGSVGFTMIPIAGGADTILLAVKMFSVGLVGLVIGYLLIGLSYVIEWRNE